MVSHTATQGAFVRFRQVSSCKKNSITHVFNAMRFMRIITVTAVWLASGFLSFATTPNDDFVYATYSVANRFRGPAWTNEANLREFNFIYLSAAPSWEVDDFDKSWEQIRAQYLDKETPPGLKHVDRIHTYIANAHRAGARVLCSFPGEKFIDIASHPQRRNKFARLMAAWVQRFQYDGIELDWEHTITIPLHIAMMKEIRCALNELKSDQPFYVTTALHPGHKYSPEQAKELSAYCDWINIMFYDMGGGCWQGRKATHNSPLNAMKRLIGNWQAFSPDKLCIGLASYGFYYKDLQPKELTPEGRVLADHGRYWNYTELPGLIQQGWTGIWDDPEHGAFMVSPDKREFVTLETPRSIDLKLDWVQECGFRGVFWWEFHCDWVPPNQQDQRGTHLIMDHVSRRLRLLPSQAQAPRS